MLITLADNQLFQIALEYVEALADTGLRISNYIWHTFAAWYAEKAMDVASGNWN